MPGEAAHDRDLAQCQAGSNQISRYGCRELLPSLIFFQRLHTFCHAFNKAKKQKWGRIAAPGTCQALPARWGTLPSRMCWEVWCGILCPMQKAERSINLEGKASCDADIKRVWGKVHFAMVWVTRWVGPPARLVVLKSMVEAIIARREKDLSLGKHWITCFLIHHSDLTVNLSSRLDRQRALASNPSVITDYFNKIYLNNFYKNPPTRETSTNIFSSYRV